MQVVERHLLRDRLPVIYLWLADGGFDIVLASDAKSGTGSSTPARMGYIDKCNVRARRYILAG